MKNNVITFVEYQKLLKAIFCFFDKACRENGIKYTVCSGTLIGVARHGDIIPWDGDIDVAMTRENFKKLEAFFSTYNGRYYLSQLPKDYIKHGWKKDYGLLHPRIVDKKCNNLLFCIDVYTIDFLGDDYQKAQVAVEKYNKFMSWSRASVSFHLPPLHNYNTFLQNLRNILLHIFHPLAFLVAWFNKPFFNRAYSKFQKEYLSYPENSKYYTLKPYYGRMGIAENDLGEYIDLPFGKMKAMCIKKYDEALKRSYGDYMKIPPKDKQIPYPSEKELTKIKFEMDEELEMYLNLANE